jgi:transposase
MLYAGLDLSRTRLDFHLLDADGATVEVGAAPPDVDGLGGLTQRLARHGEPIRAAIESMNGARFVHDRLELHGWQVEIADAQKVKGLAPLACKTDRSTPGCWPSSPAVTWCRRSGCPTRRCVPTANARAGGCTSSGTARALKQRVHAVLLTHGKPCPVSDLSACAVASCSRSSGCRSRGKGRSRPACVGSTSSTGRSATASASCAGSAPTTPRRRASRGRAPGTSVLPVASR